ncbi:MAG: hypothetical protein IPP55_02750 [Anaerolineales bacterium]|nr:hypothetical protein [Anaerolineales bacterium]
MGNDEGGIGKLIKKLQALNPELIVVEATGGYQRAVVLGLDRSRAACRRGESNASKAVRPRQWTLCQDRQAGCLQPGRVREADETEAV